MLLALKRRKKKVCPHCLSQCSALTSLHLNHVTTDHFTFVMMWIHNIPLLGIFRIEEGYELNSIESSFDMGFDKSHNTMPHLCYVNQPRGGHCKTINKQIYGP